MSDGVGDFFAHRFSNRFPEAHNPTLAQKFRQASWEEALDLIGEKLKKLRDDGEPEKVVLFSRFSSAMIWDGKFFDLYGTPNNVGYGDTCWQVVHRSCKTILGFGAPGTHSSDFENADYGLIVGRNLGGAIIPHGWGAQFGKGLRRGLPMTVVDPGIPMKWVNPMPSGCPSVREPTFPFSWGFCTLFSARTT